MSQLVFFRIREVEVKGTRYLEPRAVVARMRVDTLRSIWEETDIFRSRIESHPQVTSAEIKRRLPSTLIVVIRENLPVALIPAAAGFQAYDSSGRLLPMDPQVSAPDLPVVLRRDPAILALLGRIRAFNPVIFQRISEVSRPLPGELLFLLASGNGKTSSAASDTSALDSVVSQNSVLRVRVPLGVTVARLADIFPVENDLNRRQVKVAELDLRYRDQVIARLQ